MTLDILYFDDALLIVNKQEFVRSVATVKHSEHSNVLQLASQEFPDAKIVHRLDMDTSGLMLLARGTDAQRKLNNQFQSRIVKKEYTAIVAGHIGEQWGCIDLPIIKDWPNRPRQRIDFNNGKPALSYYRVDDRSHFSLGDQQNTTPVSRLTLFPETGRSHQLRIHLRSLGHPLAGCDLYGTEHSYALSPRLLLHSSKLEFLHPDTGKPFVIEHAAPF